MQSELTNIPAEPAGRAPLARLRRARPSDAAAIARLLSAYAGCGLLLPAGADAVLRALPSFLVAVERGRVVACGALVSVAPGVAELRSLAVAPDRRGRGLGRRVATALLARACETDVEQVLALTHARGFFERLGFREVDPAADRPALLAKRNTLGNVRLVADLGPHGPPGQAAA